MSAASLSHPFKAIAAMSLNRVIGDHNRIPWHLPEDFKWFKKITMGNVLIMGRKTYESIGGPLPGRTTIVLSRTMTALPGVVVKGGLDEIDPSAKDCAGRELFICGGAEVYQQALPKCSDLFLTAVKSVVQGDTLFPPFEQDFFMAATLADTPTFRILHYQNAHMTHG
jgi:dihydrofolate reductase